MDPKSFIVLVPILIFMIPIIAILTKHQQRMAELIHQNPQNNPQLNPQNSNQGSEIASLRYDVARLHETVSVLAISVDNLKDEVRSGSGLQDRVKASE